ncbi:mitochondrial substrate carrier protein [Klebsormidium nitens]|uniref:Mitochondrial substrate carrier protein n=1 Tax=Klebsormidium nitens TaxID=105231 RepID=A0A1Y1IJ74_KLENI|nr:mitochondrial substrate carrier protein [Klebsormidium nitens]|eukprot:GAQ88168.1 mitochondrial substrate carrier protein [Klebsormidium nitens]
MPSLFPWLPLLNPLNPPPLPAFAMAAVQSSGCQDSAVQSPLHFATNIAANATQAGHAFPDLSLPQSLAAERQASSAGASTSGSMHGDHTHLRSSDGSAQNLHLEGQSAVRELELKERAISAAAAAFLSAIIVNPLDVAKTRLQAQAAGRPDPHPTWNFRNTNPAIESLLADQNCPRACPRLGNAELPPLCSPKCYSYTSTWDVMYKVVRQEGFFQLWRGTGAGLAIAVPTVGIYMPLYDIFREKLERETQLGPYAPFLAGAASRSVAVLICSPLELVRTRMQAQKADRPGVKPKGISGTLLEAVHSVREGPGSNVLKIRALWAGVGVQLARDVPFSAICWGTLEPIRRKLLEYSGGPDPGPATIVSANFTAGLIAGSLAGLVTCPLDVAKTLRQIEMDPEQARKMNTWQTLKQVYRREGIRGLFTGAGPRMGRAGPSVGIVVSFYEVVKYMLHRSTQQDGSIRGELVDPE